MEEMNPDILIPAVAGLVTLIVLAAIWIARSTGSANKRVKGRLNAIRRRHGAHAEDPMERSIRLNQKKGGLAESLAELLPRRDVLRARLAQAGLKADLGRYAMISAAVWVGATFLNLVLGLPLLAAFLFGLASGAGLPHFYVKMSANARMKKFTSQFPEAIDLMVRGLKSGLPVNETIANVAVELKAPTGTEFQRIIDQMRLGKQLEEALWEAATRLDTPDFKFFVTSLSVQRETGGNLAETLGNLSTILRSRQQMKLKVKALSSEAKASAWIVGLLPFIMLSIIMLVNYDYGIVLFTHPTAIVAGIIALCWMSLGVFIMSRMISFDV